MKLPGEFSSTQELQATLWWKLCHLIDGVAFSSTAHALHRAGVLGNATRANGPLNSREAAGGIQISGGYYHLALRLLADQGFIWRQGVSVVDGTDIGLTESGREWVSLCYLYEHSMVYYAAALRFSEPEAEWRVDDPVLARFDALPELEQRVRLHLVSPLLLSFLLLLHEAEILVAGKSSLNADSIKGNRACVHYCLIMLQELGWVTRRSGGNWDLSEEGKLLHYFIPQLFYPLSYLKTFQLVPGLIFPGFKDAQQTCAREAGEESHIDRSLDIRFSGLVYRNNYREPVKRILAAIFDSDSPGEQPCFIVDTGSGDGTVLHDMYRLICDETRRGKVLGEYPLTMVGIEYNRVAREATAARLRENGVPFLALEGDVSQPEQIGKILAAHGVLPDQTLHFSKSVIHNRIYEPAVETMDLGTWHPRSESVFTGNDGELIDVHDMACNLVQHFRRWSPLTGKFGMIAIEAHSVPPAQVAGSLGRNILTTLISSHGYSRQYLVEHDMYERALQLADYSREAVVARSLPGVEAIVLTVDYLKPIEEKASTGKIGSADPGRY